MLCNRLHERDIDFDNTRFVVSVGRGLTIDGELVERGSEVPRGALDARFLRLEYRAHHINTFEQAQTDPDLCEACAQSGVDLKKASAIAHSVTPKFPKKVRQV